MNFKNFHLLRLGSRSTRGIKLRLGVSPKDDWKIIFSTTSILVVLAVVTSLWVFLSLDRREVFVVMPVGQDGEELINLNALKRTAQHYQTKKVEFEKLLTGSGPRIVDPSL